MTTQTLFISDLHLEANQPIITDKFLDFLAKINPNTTDAVYILGDLFEVWIGDDERTPYQQTIMNALQQAYNRGIAFYFQAGNRDFLIGKKFAKYTGCTLLPEEATIHLYGKPVLLMHGDTLCTNDIAYLQARKKWRRPIILTLFLLLPLRIRKKIAARMRNKSKAYTKTTQADIMDVTQMEVEKKMEKYQVNYLIHGHTHRPAIHEFKLQDAPAYRIVLGAWHEKGSALVWQSDGSKELIYF